jgi:hypothetical protein
MGQSPPQLVAHDVRYGLYLRPSLAMSRARPASTIFWPANTAWRRPAGAGHPSHPDRPPTSRRSCGLFATPSPSAQQAFWPILCSCWRSPATAGMVAGGSACGGDLWTAGPGPSRQSPLSSLGG